MLFGIDKLKALKHKWRIKENTLLSFLALAPFGAFMGMLVFRHKIKKNKFRFLVTLLLIVHATIFVYYKYFLI